MKGLQNICCFPQAIFMAFEKTEIGIRRESTWKSVFSSHDPSKMSEPPQKRKFSTRPRSKFRSNRVHQIDDDYGGDPEEAEEAEPDPYKDEGDPQEGKEGEQASEEGEEASVSCEEESDALVPIFLAGISMDKTGK